MHQVQTDASGGGIGGDSPGALACEVIVAVELPLFRDMLSRLIDRTEGLHLQAELAGPSGLVSLLSQTDAQWVIVTLGSDGEMPEFVDSLLADHPSVSVLGVAEDGSGVQIEHAGSAAEILASPSLALLIGVLLENGQHDRRVEEH